MKLFDFHGLYLYVPRGIFNPVVALSAGLVLDSMKRLAVSGSVVDFGCGSGVISVYVAKYFGKRAYCIDVSTRSLAVARVNASLNGVPGLVEVVATGSVNEVESVELVVTNPPYLPLEPLDSLDVNWCGGRDLRYMYYIIDMCIRLLARGGSILVTVSTISGVDRLVRHLLMRGLRVVGMGLARTPLDTIYVLHAVKNS